MKHYIVLRSSDNKIVMPDVPHEPDHIREQPVRNDINRSLYKEAVQQAIANAPEFKDQQLTIAILYREHPLSIQQSHEKDKPYPVDLSEYTILFSKGIPQHVVLTKKQPVNIDHNDEWLDKDIPASLTPKQDSTCVHMYSRSISEPRPRKCIHCGEPELEDSAHKSDHRFITLKAIVEQLEFCEYMTKDTLHELKYSAAFIELKKMVDRDSAHTERRWCDSCGEMTTWINGECENYKAVTATNSSNPLPTEGQTPRVDELRHTLNLIQQSIENDHRNQSELKESWNLISGFITEFESQVSEGQSETQAELFSLVYRIMDQGGLPEERFTITRKKP